MRTGHRQLLTLLVAAFVVIAPLMLFLDSETEFAGVDSQAIDEVRRIEPEHEPWFEPLWSPPGSETESLLFAVQAAFGAGVIGYVAGVIRTRSRLRHAAAEAERPEAEPSS